MTNEYKEITPAYASIHPWEKYMAELGLEYQQSFEEGKDIAQYKNLFNAAAILPEDKNKEEIADVLFRIIMSAGTRADYPYNEPSDLETIRRLRDGKASGKTEISDKNALKEKIRGAWYGRICGCLLGKPVEGMRTNELIPFLRDVGNYPMTRYLRNDDLTEEIAAKYTYPLSGRLYPAKLASAPSDDDTNYTVMAQVIIDRYGRDFTPANVADTWLNSQPKYAYCTAERAAFRNFTLGYLPPDSAVYHNPYREWIGAQIRGDYYGYINPGDPEKAAEMAWRDASISHVKNGIYGEMFASAMIAQAAVTSDIKAIIAAGLSQIPATSRLYEAVKKVVSGYENGVPQEKCFETIHAEYDEYSAHGWCHTISNAMVVTACLLYGGGNYGKTICMAVGTGFDTDCNAATAGSILGMRNGFADLGSEWTDVIGGRLDTAIFGVGTVTVDDAVEKTMKHIASM